MTTTMTHPIRTAEAPDMRPDFAAIPFRRLLRVEWSKATDTRAARWLLALVGLSTIGLMLIPLLAPGHIDQDYVTYLSFAALGLSILLPVVAILTLTSEWSQRTVLATFTQEPRRTRVINAKIAVSLLLATAGAAFGGLVTAAGLAVASASGRALESNLDASLVLGYLLFVLLNVLVGVAFGAILHNSAAAIVLIFVLPTAFGLLGQAVKSVAEWIDSGTAFTWILNGDYSGHVPQILVSVSLWVAIPLAAGFVRTARREIK